MQDRVAIRVELASGTEAWVDARLDDFTQVLREGGFIALSDGFISAAHVTRYGLGVAPSILTPARLLTEVPA